jgi:ATPase subunit of ABC transporter with duplicated ATPase domains
MLDAVPDRLVAIEERQLRSYEGGWADLVAARAEAETEAEPPPPPVKAPKPKQPAASPRATSELRKVEARIDALEQRVAELEAKLAADWTNMDVLALHRAARDELQALLARWEELFEAVQAEA